MPESESAGRRRLDATVHGDVQGVGFRVLVIRTAMQSGIVGWVANESRGTVRTVAEGSGEALEALLEVLRAGPAAAHVDRVDASWSAPTGEFRSFEIRSGWHGGD
ncbi:MAG: acylphosphatase [Chloroflexota bacterium]|jgi:acylphosphatase|nr:acylphosphatase [Chloroflexota bacterium]